MLAKIDMSREKIEFSTQKLARYVLFGFLEEKTGIYIHRISLMFAMVQALLDIDKVTT